MQFLFNLVAAKIFQNKIYFDKNWLSKFRRYKNLFYAFNANPNVLLRARRRGITMSQKTLRIHVVALVDSTPWLPT